MEKLLQELQSTKRTWLVTGCAGFIGSHISETLLKANQKVIGIDNMSTGLKSNLELLNNTEHGEFIFYLDSIEKYDLCLEATRNVDFVIHQAALGSVPRSIDDPTNTFKHNIQGFINILEASRINNVKSFVFASSSSVYGDNDDELKTENNTGTLLSPYACSKKTDEIIGMNYNLTFGMKTIGLRYFNVFGPRQNPDGPYAAVIPKWTEAFLNKKSVEIFGKGDTSRDFCYVQNTVYANLLACLSKDEAFGEIYNIACGDSTSLNDLYSCIQENLELKGARNLQKSPIYKDYRKGDIKNSLANINKAKNNLGYTPLVNAEEGLKLTIDWYMENI